MNMKKITILFSLCFGAANSIQADQTSYCEAQSIAHDINSAPRGDKNAKKLYNEHCKISNQGDDRCEYQWVSYGIDRYQENVCTKATLKE